MWQRRVNIWPTERYLLGININYIIWKQISPGKLWFRFFIKLNSLSLSSLLQSNICPPASNLEIFFASPLFYLHSNTSCQYNPMIIFFSSYYHYYFEEYLWSSQYQYSISYVCISPHKLCSYHQFLPHRADGSPSPTTLYFRYHKTCHYYYWLFHTIAPVFPWVYLSKKNLYKTQD